jgi:hypothetical protein
VRIVLFLALAASSCTTTTSASARKASAIELRNEATSFSTADDVDALVFDFPRQKVLSLSGRVSSWLGWLDERSPRGTVESLPNAGELAAPIVDFKIGDGKLVPCALAPQQPRTTLPRDIFDARLLEGVSDALEGVQLSIATSEVGTFTVSLGAQCVVGADVLSKLVVLVPQRGRQPLLILVPHE